MAIKDQYWVYPRAPEITYSWKIAEIKKTIPLQVTLSIFLLRSGLYT